jgi:hypothetical protein
MLEILRIIHGHHVCSNATTLEFGTGSARLVTPEHPVQEYLIQCR